MAFGTAGSTFYKVADPLSDSLFLFDILLNFFTAYTESSGSLQTNLRAIGRRYVRTWFIVDLMSSLPLDNIAQGGPSTTNTNRGVSPVAFALKATRLLKLVRMVRFLRLADSKEMALYLTPSMVRLMKTILFLLWMWHLIACIFWYILTYEGIGSTGWGPEAIHYMNSRTLNYLLSVQWTLQTTFSFGSPNFPETTVEVAFTIVCVLVGIIMNAYVIGSAGSALQNLDAEKNQRRQQLDRIITYMKRRKLPSYFQRIILDFYEYFGDKSSEDNILTDLPGPIQFRLSLLLNRELVKNIPVLRTLEFKTIVALMQHLTSKMYLPGEFIFKVGDHGDYLYFVKTGQLELIIAESGQVIMSLLRGDMFGQQALTNGQPHDINCRAVVYSEVLHLEAATYFDLADQSCKLSEMVEFEAIKQDGTIQRSKKNLSKFQKLNKSADGSEKTLNNPPAASSSTTPGRRRSSLQLELLNRVVGLFKKR